MTTNAARVWNLDTFRASDFFQPHRAAFWLYLLLLAPLGVLQVKTAATLAARAGPIPFLVGFVLLVLWAWIIIWFIRHLDLFKGSPASLQVAAFIWGALIAFALASQTNTNLFTLITRANPDMLQTWGAALVGPTTEEVLKALGVVMVVLIAGHKFHRLMDGFIYGALAGLGFEFTEDILYMFKDANALDVGATLVSVLQEFGVRVVILGPLTHVTYTALVGFGIAYYVVKRDKPRSKRLLILGSLFVAAWLFHFLNNGPASNWPALIGVSQLQPVAFLTVILNGLLAIGLAAWLYGRARRDENRWFRGVLTDDIGTELITAQEVDSLSTLRRRHRARRAARRAGGRDASRLVAELQRAQISYGQAKDRASPGSQELNPPRQRIREIRGSLAGLSRLSVEGA